MNYRLYDTINAEWADSEVISEREARTRLRKVAAGDDLEKIALYWNQLAYANVDDEDDWIEIQNVDG